MAFAIASSLKKHQPGSAPSDTLSQGSQRAASGGLRNCSELGIEAETGKLSYQTRDLNFFGMAIEVIGTKIFELGTVLEHVVDRGEHRGGTAFLGPRCPAIR